LKKILNISNQILIVCFMLFYTLDSFAATEAEAKEEFQKIESSKSQDAKVMTITQMFSQTLANALPEGFEPASENLKEGFYIQEFVLKGETKNFWTQKITITGSKGLSLNPNVTPEKFVNFVAGGIKSVCPQTFSATSFGAGKIDGNDAFGMLMGCGEVPTSQGKVSETNLTFTIKGEVDYYSIQWAARGFPSSSKLDLDTNSWNQRMSKLKPIKLCSIVSGEQKPYPSCTAQIK
jgi:hypothetical protein